VREFAALLRDRFFVAPKFYQLCLRGKLRDPKIAVFGAPKGLNMLDQILLGSVLIVVTLVIEVLFIEVTVRSLRRLRPALEATSIRKTTIVLIGITLWLLAAMSIAIWIWALTLRSLDVFDTLEGALYFSMVAFTTLGLGDLTLPVDWRLLSGFLSANGLFLFGLNTAILIEVMRRMLDED
jgi:type IV secretory pathway TrbD component